VTAAVIGPARSNNFNLELACQRYLISGEEVIHLLLGNAMADVDCTDFIDLQ